MKGDSCHCARSETIPQLGTVWPEEKWSHFRSWRPVRVLAGAQPDRPIRMTTPLWVVTPARTTGSIKGWVAEPLVVVVQVSFLPIVPVFIRVGSFCLAWYR